MTAALVIATLLSSLLVETGAELVIEKYFTDDEPGVMILVAPGVPEQMVNLLPQETIAWQQL